MHAMLNARFKNHKNIKFDGKDLALVIGDVMYALALHAFLSVKEKAPRKEEALKKLIAAALYTGSGELIELLAGAKDIDKIKREDIYKIYDYKTANYTFASPLSMGATLAGANKKELDILFKLGIALGRAFQIKDDYLGLFGKTNEIGKSNLTDLQEAKKTILLMYAYNKSNPTDKATIKRIFSKKSVTKKDLKIMRLIVSRSGALEYAKNEINSLIKKAESISTFSKMHPSYKDLILDYSKKMLRI